MTQPNPDGAGKPDAGKPDAGKPDAGKAAPKVKRGDVVNFTAVDAHTGDEYTGLGVVASAAGGTVTVRPLADYTVQALDAEPIVVDEG